MLARGRYPMASPELADRVAVCAERFKTIETHLDRFPASSQSKNPDPADQSPAPP